MWVKIALTSCLRSSVECWYCQYVRALWDLGLHSRKVLLFSTPYTVLSRRVVCPLSSSGWKEQKIKHTSLLKQMFSIISCWYYWLFCYLFYLQWQSQPWREFVFCFFLYKTVFLLFCWLKSMKLCSARTLRLNNDCILHYFATLSCLLSPYTQSCTEFADPTTVAVTRGNWLQIKSVFYSVKYVQFFFFSWDFLHHKVVFLWQISSCIRW